MKDKIKDALLKIWEFIKKILRPIYKVIYILRKPLIFCVGFFALIVVMSYLQLTIEPIDDSEDPININSNYKDLGFRAYYYGKEIKENKIVLTNLDVTKIGDYVIEYQVKKWFFTKRVYKNISVQDLEGPTIELNGSDLIYIPVNAEFVDPKYTVYDNVDGEISPNKVNKTGYVNTKIAKEYILTYSVQDKAGNIGEATRKVVVTDNDYLNCDVDKFWLDKIYSGVILKPQSEEIDYFDDVVMIGDCNTYFLYSYSRLIKAEQCWGKSNLNISEINNSTFKTFVDAADRTFDEAMEKFKPKYLIVNPGLGSPLFMNDTELFQKEITKFIDHMEEKYPDTVFVFSAIMPLTDGQLPKTFQKKINTYNYLLAEICYNRGVKIMNFADTVRGKDGYGIKENYIFSETDVNDRGFHFEEKTRSKLVEYIKHIDLNGGK